MYHPFESQIPFSSLVCVTGISVGAVPGVIRREDNSFINIFARDVRTPGAARFACLYEGLQQPVAGTSTIPVQVCKRARGFMLWSGLLCSVMVCTVLTNPSHRFPSMQQFVTDHIVIRGRFQTAPVTLHGFELDAMASDADANPSPTLPTLDEALLVKFCDVVPEIMDAKYENGDDGISSLQTQEKQQGQSTMTKETVPKLLKELLEVWHACGANPHLLHAHSSRRPLNELACKTIAAADTVCDLLSADALSAHLEIPQKITEVATATLKVYELVDMVMGWMGLLADVQTTKSTKFSFRDRHTHLTMATFGSIGLAASVLVCFYLKKSASELFISRHGQLLLAEALDPLGHGSGTEDVRAGSQSGPALPTSQVRHAAATALLIVQAAESWGCEALLGWWQPKFVQWTTKKGENIRESERNTTEPTIPQVDGSADERKRPRRDAREDLEEIRRSKRRELNKLPVVDPNDRFRPYAKKSVSYFAPPPRPPTVRDASMTREESRKSIKRENDIRRSRNTKSPVSVETQREDADYMHATSTHWDRRLKEFPGVYSPLVVAFTSLLPRSTARICAQVLNVLRFYEHVATFAVSAERVIDEGCRLADCEKNGDTLIMKQSYGRCAAAASAISKILGRSDSWMDPDFAFRLLSSRDVLSLIPPLLRVLRLVPCSSTLAHLRRLLTAIVFGRNTSILRLFVSHTGPQYLGELYEAMNVHGASFKPLVSAFCGLIVGTVCIVEACDGLIEGLSECGKSPWSVPLLRLSMLASESSETSDGLMYAATRSLDRFMPACWKALELRSRCGQAMNAGDDDEDIVCLDGMEVKALDVVMDMLLSLTFQQVPEMPQRLVKHASTALTLLPQLSHSLLTSLSMDAMATYSNILLLHGRFRAIVAAGHPDVMHSVRDLLDLLDSNLPPYDPSSFTTAHSYSYSDSKSSSSSTFSFSLPWASVRSFWDEVGARGTVETSLRLLTAILKSPTTDLAAVQQVLEHKSMRCDTSTNDTSTSATATGIMRALSVGTQVVKASLADAHWQCRAGAAIDAAKSAASNRSAIDFIFAASEFAATFLSALKRASVSPISTPCMVNALVDAHIAMSMDPTSLDFHQLDQKHLKKNQAALRLLQARCHVIAALRCCVENGADPKLMPKSDLGKQKEPNVVGIILDRVRSGPASVYAVVRCFGDLFPTEWPTAQRAQRGQHAGSIAPSRRRLRSAAAMGIEQRRTDFSELVTRCAGSEVTLLRAAVTRMVGRAAGLGGGMGTFLMRALVAALESATKSSAPGRTVHTVMQTMVPLIYLPALKAAAIEVGLALRLVALMKATDPSTHVTDDVINVNVSGSAEELFSIVTMSLECLAVLCNPDIVLDRLASQEVNEINEVLPMAQATEVAAYLFEGLPTFGENAVLGARLLGLLASTRTGRLAMYKAIITLHGTAMRGSDGVGPKEADTAAVVEAARWAAGVYRSLSEQARQAEATLLAQTFTDIVDLLKGLCTTWEVDTDTGGGVVNLEALVVTPPPAPERFVAATRAALAGEVEAGLRNEVGGGGGEEGEDASGFASNFASDQGNSADVSVQLFWKNHAERQVATSPATVKLYGRWEVDDEVFSVTSLLHPPLSHFLRPVDERMDENAVEDIPDGSSSPVPDILSAGLPPNQVVVGEGRGAATTETVEDEAVAMDAKAESMLPPLDLDLYADLNVGGGLAEPTGPVDPTPPKTEHSKEKALVSGYAGGVDNDLEGFDGDSLELEEKVEEQGMGEQMPTQDVDYGIADEHDEKAIEYQDKDPKAGQSDQFDITELLSNPSAVQNLLEDPEKLQRLLDRNPALLALLKEKLAGSQSK